MNSTHENLSLFPKSLAIFGLIFGVITLFSGGNVLFGPETAQLAAGNFVPFVVWFNFIAGFVYILTAIFMLRRKMIAFPLALIIVLATTIATIAFAQFVSLGGSFEMRTVGALAFRTGFWAVVAYILYKIKPQLS